MRVLITTGINAPKRTTPFDRYADRLVRTARPHWPDGAIHCWKDYPPGAPDHDVKPYAFKLYACLEAVRQGYTTLLYSDACVICQADPVPVFERIEQDGYLLVSDGRRLREFCSDACLAWAGIADRDGLGDTSQAAGGFVGLNLLHPLGRTLWSEWWDAYARGHTAVHWREHQKPENRLKSVAMWNEDFHISDRPDVLGHFGEESIWGALSVKYGLHHDGNLFCTQSEDGIFRSTGYDEGRLCPL